jgi:uncharacterized protein GlcG (DUF336 family)
MESITLIKARKIIDAMLKAVVEAGGLPVSVAVVDSAGTLLSFAKMEEASANSANTAINKAYTSIQWKRNSSEVRKLLMKLNMDISWFGNSRYAPLAGGILIRSADGGIVGATGCSGRMPDENPNDEEIALIGGKAYNEA